VPPLLAGGGGGGGGALPPPLDVEGCFFFCGFLRSCFSAGSAPALLKPAESAAAGMSIAFVPPPADEDPPLEAVAFPIPNATTKAATTAPIVMASCRGCMSSLLPGRPVSLSLPCSGSHTVARAIESV
jgi:hypothetical protein